jgi:glycerol-3-phosphate acyltransferase PlsY
MLLSISLLFAYFLGSVSSAVIICHLMSLPDPRSHGSNNPGATNVLRIGGKKAAIITLLSDGLKGVLPILLGHYLGLNLFEITLIALVAFLGHVYPIFFKFKGGKGVATFLGSLFAINIYMGLSFAFVWLFVAKVLKISSLSALIATLLTPVGFLYFSNNLEATYLIVVVCLWLFFNHRSNIKRLLSGDES